MQADIEAIAQMGCHACSIVTALTVQDTHDVHSVIPLPAEHIQAQAETLLRDVRIDAIKIGLIGSAECAAALADIVRRLPSVPMVLDPVLTAGGGQALADAELIAAIQTLLLPLTRVLTPNTHEARRLAPGAENLGQCGFDLLALGCRHVLITGTHEHGPCVTNRFFAENRDMEAFQWERLGHSYHGSGCTLASSLAALLAGGLDPLPAVQAAQRYTWQTLKTGFRLGQGQRIPNRLFRTNHDPAVPLS